MSDIYRHILSRIRTSILTFYPGHFRTLCTIFSMLNLATVTSSPRLIWQYSFRWLEFQCNSAIEYIYQITATRTRSQWIEWRKIARCVPLANVYWVHLTSQVAVHRLRQPSRPREMTGRGLGIINSSHFSVYRENQCSSFRDKIHLTCSERLSMVTQSHVVKEHRMDKYAFPSNFKPPSLTIYHSTPMSPSFYHKCDEIFASGAKLVGGVSSGILRRHFTCYYSTKRHVSEALAAD